ncbi:hypothetical protein [Legionella saoudiensis]|uniref:hypothetical protein n=1 Tax=Legionella saoudiensis TaxID=1750561 RepID=UPI0007303A20|nr:hypothetical protein [Legionella saoudiensis]
MHGLALYPMAGTSFFIKISLSMLILALACLPSYVMAANVGPGPISPVVQSSGGTTTIVGNTSITSSSSAVSVTNGTVELGGPNIQIQTSGTAFGFNIDASANPSFLSSLAGSYINIITTGSTYSYGLWATNPNNRVTSTMIQLSNASIRTSGNGSGGVILANLATGILSNLQIETFGGVDPGNNGAGAYGINTQFGAKGSFDNVSIVTHGVGGTGILNSNASSFTGNNITMNVQA